jgi:hypothetical protein
MRNFLFFLSFIFAVSLAYSPDYYMCNVTINEPWFIVQNDSGSDILIIDNEGDVYAEAQNHSNQSLDSSFVIGNSIFSTTNSFFYNFTQNLTQLNQNASFTIRSDTGEEVTKVLEDGSFETKGFGVYEGSQAACLPDGLYCGANDNFEDRNYYCDIFSGSGSKGGSCEVEILRAGNCHERDFFYCQNTVERWEAVHTCPEGDVGCRRNNYFVEICEDRQTQYFGWTCLSDYHRQMYRIEYEPICRDATGSCDHDSTRINTDEYIDPDDGYCHRGSATLRQHTYSWVVPSESWSACSASCGGGTQTNNGIHCERDFDGRTMPDSFCSGSRPSASRACNTQGCPCGARTYLEGPGDCGGPVPYTSHGGSHRIYDAHGSFTATCNNGAWRTSHASACGGGGLND